MQISRFHQFKFWQPLLVVGVIVALVVVKFQPTYALQPNPPDPQSSSVGVEATLGAPPPSQAGTIATPSNGAVFTSNPITVNGLCTKGLLVEIFSNNVFVGSQQCLNGSYSIQIDLFSGQNDLIVRVFDSLDQAGPDSATTTVTLNNAQFAQFGTQLSLTSSYGKRGADPGQELDWPLILSGGAGPYALSVDWGDGTAPELLSSSFDGTITISHTYRSSGVFTVIARATDKNGQAAFLQLVGVANGPITISSTTSGQNATTTKTVVEWWPSAILLPLILAAFWLGRRNELLSLRRQLEKSDEREG